MLAELKLASTKWKHRIIFAQRQCSLDRYAYMNAAFFVCIVLQMKKEWTPNGT
jgi:hypothetical protein